MGCTSAKPKRTISAEDVASKQPQNVGRGPDKNGQVNKDPLGNKEKILREKPSSETHAVEIPGAHKSFLAPDGIPFIDEDVESEADDVQLTGNQLASLNVSQNAKLGSPDQNKNIAIVANKEAKLLTTNSDPVVVGGTRPSALQESLTAGDDDPGHRKDAVTNEPTIISKIKTQEIQITTTTIQQNEAATEVTEVKSRTILTDSKQKTEEEIAVTKIQAGVRGYLDRQKVKAIRANKQLRTEIDETQDESTNQNSGPKVTEHKVEEHVECHSDDPKLEAAATKIQANYKGYRTRKEIKTSHSK